MSPTWQGDPPPAPYRPAGPGDWLRVLRRGTPVAVMTFGGLVLLLILRLAEAPLFGPRRPWTPHLVRAVCRANLWCLGFNCRFGGRAVPAPAVIAANHSSWLDIFALNAGQTVTFVAKAEVAGWPGIGWLARATGTVFIRRDPAEAAAQVALLRDRLRAGGRIALFPEGTSTDGQRVLPFKPALFAAFLEVPGLQVQPVTIRWQAPAGADPRAYGWWGNMDLGPHLLGVLARPDQGALTVIRHAPLAAEGGRKALAAAAEAAVRAGFDAQDSAA